MEELTLEKFEEALSLIHILITVAVDGMGGDNAPACMVQGAVDAVNKNSNIKVLLTGRPDELNKALEGLTYDKSRLEIVPASEVIETGAPPVESVRTKKDSSLVVGLKLVKEQKAEDVYKRQTYS